MNELLGFLRQFCDCLKLQITVLSGLESVLNTEEDLIARSALSDYERVLTEKDQLVQRAAAAEKRRQQALKKLCYFIGFDLRRGLPSLSEVVAAFDSYLVNIQPLIESDIYSALCAFQKELIDIKGNYLNLFATLTPRIKRNQMILQKLEYQLKMSLSIFSNNEEYTKSGIKSQHKKDQHQIRIRA